MKKKRKYWLFVTTSINWETIKDKEIFGFNERGIRDLEKLKIDDYVIIYIKGKRIGGLFEIQSLESNIKIKFKEGDYPNKIKLKKILIPKEPLEFTKIIINNISIFKNRLRWGTILMGRATKEIKELDFYYIKNLIEEQNVK